MNLMTRFKSAALTRTEGRLTRAQIVRTHAIERTTTDVEITTVAVGVEETAVIKVVVKGKSSAREITNE